MIHIVMHTKRHFGVGAVDRTGGGVDQMPHLVVATPFKDVAEANQISIDVGEWILQ